uniref:NADH dehydrogenase subunit 6 n=1 Tax=Diptera sp. 66 LC-2017 TaxID=2030344 RepID=A0A343LA03_9DIPT|nr:NADH dehydrogenase subunit 6 [Diptera sp. 66 LC-2017]
MKMFMFFMLMINFLFINFNNPLMLGILIFIQTILMINLMGKIYYSFWFSYIFLLVFIGGLFILFFYMISLIYNNKFFNKFNNIYITMLLIFMLLNYKMIYFNNMEKLPMNYINLNNNLNMIKLYNFPNNLINLILIIILLLLLIIVVKITNFNKGPIRSNYKKKNYYTINQYIK